MQRPHACALFYQPFFFFFSVFYFTLERITLIKKKFIKKKTKKELFIPFFYMNDFFIFCFSFCERKLSVLFFFSFFTCIYDIIFIFSFQNGFYFLFSTLSHLNFCKISVIGKNKFWVRLNEFNLGMVLTKN